MALPTKKEMREEQLQMAEPSPPHPSAHAPAPAEHQPTDLESPGNEARQRRRVWWGVAVISLVASTLAAVARLPASSEKNGAGAPRDRAPTVRVATAKRASLPLSAEYRGDLDAKAAELSAQVTGRVVEMAVDIGDHFAKGDLLARIDPSEVQHQVAEALTQVSAADAAQQRAQAELAAAQTELERGEKLASQNLLSEQDLEARRSAVAVAQAQVSTAHAQRRQAAARVALYNHEARETRLLAPFDGAVAERYLDPGSLVQPGKRVLRLVAAGPLRVRFPVPERDVGRVEVGMPLEVTTQATGKKRFTGTVTRLAAEVSRLDRSVAAEGVLTEQTPKLLPGMYAIVHLELGRLDGAVVVPSAAVFQRETQSGTRTGVYLVDGSAARWRDVTVKGSSGDQSAVTPLEPGATVITLGPSTLRDGMAVQVAKDEGP